MKSTKRLPILLTPGPVLLTPSSQKAFGEQTLHHRSLEFQKLFLKMREKLKFVFQTKQDVLVLTSSGTGAMEASLTNTLSPKEEAICVCGGKFGERWKSIGLAYGIKIHSIEIPLGQAVSAEQVKKALKKHPKAKAFLISACETSTGTEHPISTCSSILKKHKNVLFMVDGITGIGTMNLPMDKLGIDVLIGGSQKSFMIPAGLSFISLSEKAWTFQKKAISPRYYFDLSREKAQQQKGLTAFSPSVPLIKALDLNLNLFKKKGLKHFISRSKNLAQVTHIFCKEMNLTLFSKKPSAAVTAIQVPEGISGDKIRKNLETNDRVILAGGQDSLKDKIIRIGHMGWIDNSSFLLALKALGKELHKAKPKTFSLKKLEKALHKTKENLL